MFDNNNVSDIQVIKPAERVEGCELVKMSRDKDPQSKSYRSVTFLFKEIATGAELAHREFAPGRQIGTKTLSNDEYKKNISLVHSRIAHITRAFLPEEIFKQIKVAGDIDQLMSSQNWAAIDKAWDDYISLTGQALGADANGVAKAKGVKVALKVVYKKVKDKFYASLPAVPPFISSELHPKQFSSANPQYDIYTIQKITPDVEMPKMNTGFEPQPNASFESPAPGFAASTQHESGF